MTAILETSMKYVNFKFQDTFTHAVVVYWTNIPIALDILKKEHNYFTYNNEYNLATWPY